MSSTVRDQRTVTINGVERTVGFVPLGSLLADSHVVAQMDDIFFASSLRQTFESVADRAAFRERWLGRYLGGDAAHGFLAVSKSQGGHPQSDVAGYLVAALDNPAASPRFADVPGLQQFADLCAKFPAHLHINLHPDWRGQRVGEALVEAFCAYVAGSGGAGAHVITGASLRNVRFYNRLGFTEQGRTGTPPHEAVFLGRRL